MQISDRTIEVLNNFSTINQSIYVFKPNELRTVANTKNIMSRAEVSEEWPYKFAIYDLVEFLSALKLFKEPVLDFDESGEFVTIIEKNAPKKNVRYYFANPALIFHPYPKSDDEDEKTVNLPNTEVNFIFEEDELLNVQQAAAVLQLTDMVITPSDANDKLKIATANVANPVSNNFQIEVESDLPEDEFQLIFKIENLKLLADKYDVGISQHLISHWVGDDIEYWITLDQDSTYGA